MFVKTHETVHLKMDAFYCWKLYHDDVDLKMKKRCCCVSSYRANGVRDVIHVMTEMHARSQTDKRPEENGQGLRVQR